MPKMRKTFAHTFAFYAWYFRTFVLSRFWIVLIRSPVFRRPPFTSVGSHLLNSLSHSHAIYFHFRQAVRKVQISKYQFSVLICELCVSRDFRQSTNETASSHFGSHFSSSQLAVRSSQIINIPIKGFTAKKSVVVNDDEPRPVSIPKEFAH